MHHLPRLTCSYFCYHLIPILPHCPVFLFIFLPTRKPDLPLANIKGMLDYCCLELFLQISFIFQVKISVKTAAGVWSPMKGWRWRQSVGEQNTVTIVHICYLQHGFELPLCRELKSRGMGEVPRSKSSLSQVEKSCKTLKHRKMNTD